MLLDKDFLASFAFLTTFGQIFALFGGCVSHLQTTEKDKLSFLRSNFAVWNGQTLLLITQQFLAVLQTDETLLDFGLFVWKYPTALSPSIWSNLRDSLTAVRQSFDLKLNKRKEDLARNKQEEIR